MIHFFTKINNEHNDVLSRCVQEVEKYFKENDVNPASCDNHTIQLASYYGYKEVVRLLLKDNRVDPTDNLNWAIKKASRKGYMDIVKLLVIAKVTSGHPGLIKAILHRIKNKKERNEMKELIENENNT